MGLLGGVGERGGAEAHDMEEAVQEAGRSGGRDGGAPARPRQSEALGAGVGIAVESEHDVSVTLQCAGVALGVRDFGAQRVDERAVALDRDAP